MQAVYSTSTEVKIHQAIRHEWTSFQSQWMFQQLQRLDAREREILHNAQRRWGKMKAPDKEQIAGLQEEFLEDARREWLARVRQRQLHLEHWVMTQDEKHALEQTLGWTYKDMVDAYAKEQAELGPLYQRVDPVSLGSPQPPSMSKFMHPKEPEHRPAYENWGAEIGASTSARSAHPKSPDPKHAYENWAAELARLHGKSPSKQRARSEKSAELPSMPLYFVGALLQGTDLDAVAASHLEEFAVAVSEAKIHEYYEAALKASLRFQRTLPTLDAGQREAFQDEFDVWMRELANKKEREWKAITIQELRKHQAHELQRRAAQQRAMRPRASPPRRRMRQREDYSDDGWNVINSPQTQSSRRTAQRDLFEGYQSPESWSTYLEEYQSPPPPPPPPPARARRPAESEEEYAVSSPADNWPRLRVRNVVHREDPEMEGYFEPWPAATPYEPHPEWPQLPRRPPRPRETGLLSTWTNWLGSLTRSRKRATVSSFDWMEPNHPYSRNNRKTTAPDVQEEGRMPHWGAWPEVPEGYRSEEEFPMRKGGWRDKLSLKGLRNRIKRKPSMTASDIGWADPSESSD